MKQTNPAMTTFHNPSNAKIVMSIGQHPGVPPLRVEVDAGEEFEGWPAYERFYKRHGIVKGPAPVGAPVVEAKAEPVSQPEANSSIPREDDANADDDDLFGDDLED